MIKDKLIKKRKQKGYTQQFMADKLCIDTSNYQRREKGEINISNDEWNKLSSILEVPLEEIYQDKSQPLFIIKDNRDCTQFGHYNSYSIPSSMLESQQKYIRKLEEEIEVLKQKIEDLRS